MRKLLVDWCSTHLQAAFGVCSCQQEHTEMHLNTQLPTTVNGDSNAVAPMRCCHKPAPATLNLVITVCNVISAQGYDTNHRHRWHYCCPKMTLYHAIANDPPRSGSRLLLRSLLCRPLPLQSTPLRAMSETSIPQFISASSTPVCHCHMLCKSPTSPLLNKSKLSKIPPQPAAATCCCSGAELANMAA